MILILISLSLPCIGQLRCCVFSALAVYGSYALDFSCNAADFASAVIIRGEKKVEAAHSVLGQKQLHDGQSLAGWHRHQHGCCLQEVGEWMDDLMEGFAELYRVNGSVRDAAGQGWVSEPVLGECNPVRPRAVKQDLRHVAFVVNLLSIQLAINGGQSCGDCVRKTTYPIKDRVQDRLSA